MNNFFQKLPPILLLLLCWSPFGSMHAQTPCVDSALIDPNAICITLYDPVCGCNGVTYGNACEAEHWGGVTSWTPGPCQNGNCDALKVDFQALIVANSATVTFNDASMMPNGQILSWTWDFGDGAFSSDQNPVHTFPAAGSYQVCLTVKSVDASGQTCEKTFCQSITVQVDCIDNCIFSFNYDLDGTRLYAQFGVFDPPPFFFYVNWSLDDDAFTGSGLVFTHLFNETGTHTLCATYPTGDFTAETCTVCKAFEVKTPCVDSAQIDLSVPCPLAFIPVCGCDGVTYDNACTAYNYGGVNSWLPGVCGSICNNLFVDFQGANTGGSLTKWSFWDRSVFPVGMVNSWFWTFGNGQTSMEQFPSVDFGAPGEYEVCLTASGLAADGTQCGGTYCRTITVGASTCVDPQVIDTTKACPTIYQPVCGCDGVTYANECEAYYFHGVTSWTPGVCPDQCVNAAWIDTTLACFEIYDPVCGCDGKTYENECFALHYGGITSWKKGECCQSQGCEAKFSMEILSNQTIMLKNLSTGAESAAVNFGDGSPIHFGVFDTLIHTYANPGIYQICLEISNFAGTCSDTYCLLANLSSASHEPALTPVSLQISPNPAQEIARVNVVNAQALRAILWDAMGKKIMEMPVSAAAFDLHLETIPAGIYLLELQTNRGVATGKLIKN